MTATAVLAPNGALPAGFRKKIAADFGGKVKKRAAGIMFVDPQANVLMLRRSAAEPNFAGYFAWPGGGVEESESPWDGAVREAYEEIGGGIESEGGGEGGSDSALAASAKEIDRVETPTGGVFHTFVQPVEKQFAPRLNAEHSGYVWTPLNMLPRPVHPAVEATLREQVGVADDMDPTAVKDACDGFLKWARGEDEALEQIATDSALRLALDKDSVRSTDKDGRLRVAVANITKANVCPYKGSEIPLSEMLGLEPDRIYYLLRDPEELRKAAPTLNGVPLLQKHVAVNADDHKPDEVVGSLGTDADFVDPYLQNSLFVNARSAIDGIMSGEKRELSAGYHYKADMTPGVFGGIRFDGIMRSIVFNHVALVEDGRAGPDIVVGDSTENLMSKPTRLGALALQLTAAHAAPLLALDASIVLPKALFSELTSKNFGAKKAALLAGVKLALDGKMRKGLAFDESGLAKLIDALEDTASKGVDDAAPDDVEKAMEKAASGESALAIPAAPVVKPEEKKAGFDAEAVKSFLREKGLGEDDIAAVSGMFPSPATDEFPKKDDEESDEEKAKKKAEADKKAAEDEAKMKDMVTKPAMDAALKVHGDTITKQVRDAERGVRTALDTVEPWVGKLPGSVTMAFDTAEHVHRHAAKMLGVPNADKLHADSLLPIIQSRPRPGQPRTNEPPLAMDAATAKSFAERFPDAARIERV